MSATTEEIPFSQLIQHPKATMAKLEGSRRRLRQDRRDSEDLILESAAARAEAEDKALGMACQVRHERGGKGLRRPVHPCHGEDAGSI